MTGRGIATLRQVLDIAFSELKLHRLHAETLTDNPASQRVLRRCGFVDYGRGPEYLKIPCPSCSSRNRFANPRAKRPL